MRIVIDLQATQSMSRSRGIGRYALSLTDGILRQCGHHEIILVLSALFPATLEPLITHFKSQCSEEQIHIWYASTPVHEGNPQNSWRTATAKCLREAYLAQLKPDIVLLTSLFEGHVDNAVTSINYLEQHIPTAVILYDLIPLIHPNHYLKPPSARQWYLEKIEELKHAELILTISASVRDEAINAKLGIPHDAITNISGAANPYFKKIIVSQQITQTIREQYGITRDFLMYTGGIDFRKNIDGLIRGYALLPAAIRQHHQLAIVCSIRPHDKKRFIALAKQHGLNTHDLIFTDFVNDEHLRILYNLCKAFIFPSWHEGFGLPILEAMQCGVPVIGANVSSIPEVIGQPEALFDPFDDQAIAQKIEAVLTDEPFRQRLIEHAKQQPALFSWDNTAKTALRALETWYQQQATSTHHKLNTEELTNRIASITGKPSQTDLLLTAQSMMLNQLDKTLCTLEK